MKNLAISTGSFAAIIVIIFLVLHARTARAPGAGACGNDVNICFDGSKVGRTGPNCSFAACPKEDDSLYTGTTTITMALNEKKSALGISITPLQVLEDNRCPKGTECIQAGTVQVSARFATSKGDILQIFRLNQPVLSDLDTVTLTGVSPERKADVKISNYSLTFTVAKRPQAPLYTSSMSGKVMVGPTCPVAKNPPDPKCADKPLSTSVILYRNGAADPFATTTSKADGSFSLSIPPGSYVVTAGSSNRLPRCAPVQVALPLDGHVNISVFCDSGIR